MTISATTTGEPMLAGWRRQVAELLAATHFTDKHLAPGSH